MDDVSLTVIPANAANSAEASGLRVDGLDTLTQNVPAGFFSPVSFWYRWGWTPRHDAADLVKYGNAAPTLLHVWGDATNYVRVYATAANNIRLEYDAGGAGVQVANWNCTGLIVAGTTYKMEARGAGGAWVRLYVDNAVVAEIVNPFLFTTVPTVAYGGSLQDSTQQADSTYSSP